MVVKEAYPHALGTAKFHITVKTINSNSLRIVLLVFYDFC